MIIKIENLRLRTIIGIYDWEKKNRQDLVINVTIDFDGRKAAESDSIEDTLDYKAINKKIISFVEETSFNLLERVAGGICGIVLEYPAARSASVKVEKPGALRFADSVSVTEARER
ncbi:MAG: dihydroneopterin aldolase [Candidatus Dadabacteria bacterium]|nr:dihydroneopterin aldolase [Candidatus Dadabacteria bacterium]